jgi:hypothetical protein
VPTIGEITGIGDKDIAWTYLTAVIRDTARLYALELKLL